jgi:hypothetical protein
MSSIDLEKYREAWQSEKAFEEARIASEQIKSYMQRSSGNLFAQVVRSLFFDLTLKGLMMAGFLYLLLAPVSGSIPAFIPTSLAMLCLAAMLWQLIAIRKRPGHNAFSGSTRRMLNAVETYFRDFYRISTVMTALSASLFFALGSIFYFQKNYSSAPAFTWDDWVVFGGGFILAFAFSFLIHWNFARAKFKNIRELGRELEKENPSNRVISEQINQRKRWLWFAIALASAGLVLFFLLYFAF